MNTSSKFVVASHIMTILGGKSIIFGSDEGSNSDEISFSVGTNPVVIRRLLGKLKDYKLVVSKPGPYGGYFLSKPASEIKLSDIYSAVEDGKLFHMHYSKPNSSCNIGHHIQDILGEVLNKAQAAFLTTLESKTVLDLSKSVMEKSEDMKSKSIEEIRAEWKKGIEQIKKDK